MRLKDLVHRSALRTRSAGETEIAGAPHVFEATNVLFPAGADVVHILGSFDATWRSLISYCSLLERDVLTGNAPIRIGFGLDPADPDNSFAGGGFGPDPYYYTTQTLNPVIQPIAFLWINRTGAIPDETITLCAYVWNNGPVPNDVTVRARVAFQVF